MPDPTKPPTDISDPDYLELATPAELERWLAMEVAAFEDATGSENPQQFAKRVLTRLRQALALQRLDET